MAGFADKNKCIELCIWPHDFLIFNRFANQIADLMLIKNKRCLTSYRYVFVSVLTK